jgi:hypothetical protein
MVWRLLLTYKKKEEIEIQEAFENAIEEVK